MNAQFQVAQASGSGNTTGNSAPPRIYKLTKPLTDQAVTVDLGYDQKIQVDFSAIANEKITLVHIGEKLVILFDNSSTVTIEPFFDSRHDGLVTFEMGQGREFSVAEFTSQFPINTDSSVLPAADLASVNANANAQASGAHFDPFAVDPLNLPNPLPLLPEEELPNFVVQLPTGFVLTTTTVVTPSTLSGTSGGTVDEGALTHSTTPGSGDLFGTGTDVGEAGASVATGGSLSGLVQFGSDGPAATPFSFVSTAAASAWVHGLGAAGLESHGSFLDHATISGSTLTAFAADGHEVFTVTLTGAGAWTFTLINPLDHAPSPVGPDSSSSGEQTIPVDLSGLFQANGAGGEVTVLSGDVTVTVIDDSMQLASEATSNVTVDEGALTAVTDLHGSGTDVGEAGAVVTATGSLTGLVQFGADGPLSGSGFTFVTAAAASSWLSGLGLTSHGFAVDTATISSNTLTALDSNGDHVFTLTLNSTTGAWTFTLLNPIDQAPSPINDSGGPETATTLDLSGLFQANEFDGEHLTLSGDVQVTVIDDSLQLTSGTSSGTVDEGALTFSSATGSGDQFGSGTDVGESGAVVTASGSLSGLVNFGADGPDGVGGVAYNGTSTNPFQFTVGTASDLAAAFNAANPGITSHGETITSITDNAGTLTASTADHVVFTMTLDASGHWTFTLVNPIDQA
ncbi:MAG TPA: DUF5801 repeats-in-toxin domain-containing protein, partial [Bradyrhizobium sp.]|nr:DUF5801 repeats-in-toxin domain-containing protein [Bradyrhizobium sp.]